MMMMTPVLYRLTAALIAALALGSLALQLHLGLERWPGRTLWVESWRMGRYFTVLTNLLLGLSCAAIALGWRARDSWLAGLVLWIGIVGIVYHALLARELEGLRRLADAGQHTVVPLLTLLWWMMFAPKRGLAPRHAVWWLSWRDLCRLCAGPGRDRRAASVFLCGSAADRLACRRAVGAGSWRGFLERGAGTGGAGAVAQPSIPSSRCRP